MQFKIEQIALAPRDPKAARKLLEAIGAVKWVEDTVVADGEVQGSSAINKALLQFNYDMFDGKELEILNYQNGPNWLTRRPYCVSHLGMHTTAEDLVRWRDFFASRGIKVAQEVYTVSHTNPFLLKTGRKYHYVIFDTFEILGVDLKFIVRREGE